MEQHASLAARRGAIEAGIAALRADRIHGSGYLARKALGIMTLAEPPDRPALGGRLAALRPEMPAIAAAVREAMESGDSRAVIRRADAERRRVARAAMRTLRRRRVATISNSSLVERALVYASPLLVQVVVEDAGDEGHVLVANLTAGGIHAIAVPFTALDADVAVVGCDAVFDDGTFMNRRGTLALVTRMPALVLVDRWKRVGGPAPDASRVPEPFELIPGDRVRAPA
ncbi:MAG TPA: hypothetical protein VFL27_01375 [Candidatus Dormibacteraeota bacterium]|nr:hypothetical protein [Candidatus Dormibacteraeota bacterium]